MKSNFNEQNTVVNINPNPIVDKLLQKSAITNYDFIVGLDVFKFAELIYEKSSDVCDCCAYVHTNKCSDGRCVGGIIELLKQPYDKKNFEFL